MSRNEKTILETLNDNSGYCSCEDLLARHPKMKNPLFEAFGLVMLGVCGTKTKDGRILTRATAGTWGNFEIDGYCVL